MAHYRWLLFDADGTLFDYDAAERTALERSFREIDQPFGPEMLTVYRRVNAHLWQQFEAGRVTADRLKTQRFEQLFEELRMPGDAAAFSARYLINLSRVTDLIDDAEAVLASLAERCRIGIITNGLTTVQRPRFSASALAPYFEVIVISDEIGVAKPDPRIFDAAFELMEHPARDAVLIIGDSLTSDMRGGEQYGIDTCWFNPARRPNTSDVAPTYEIAHLQELFTILEKGSNP